MSDDSKDASLELDLRKADLASLDIPRTVDSVVIKTLDAAAAVRVIAERAPHLRSLVIGSSNEAAIAIPDEIGQLAALESLTFKFFPVKSLPSAFAELRALKTLSIMSLASKTLPDVVCDLPALESLSLHTHLNTLPASFAKLKMLKSLFLYGVLNGGALVSRFDEIKNLKPLPKVLSAMTSLEELVLDHCGVFDAAPLRSLARLRRLSLAWAPLATVADIATLSNLEVLALEHVDRVTDLSPLSNLKKLRELAIPNTRPKSLDFVRDLPALQVLDIESVECKNLGAIHDLDVDLRADDEVKERFAQRLELRKLPPVATIVERLAATDLSTLETAMSALATWTLASSTRDDSALLAAFGAGAVPTKKDDDEEDEEDDEDDDLAFDPDFVVDGDDDGGDGDDEDESDDEPDDDRDAGDDDDDDAESGGRVEALLPLVRALDAFGDKVSPKVLAHLFGALFQRMEENFSVAKRVADEIARRGDDEAQLALVAALEKASEHYDTGHRMWEDTVQDHLIDEVFPQLRGPALARLCGVCSNGHFADDGMENLWAPALSRATKAEADMLGARLEKYLEHRLDYADEAAIESLWTTLDAVTGNVGTEIVRGVRDKMSERIDAARASKAVESGLRSHDPERTKMAILAVLGMKREDQEELSSALASCSASSVALDDEALAALLRILGGPKPHWGLADVLCRVAVRGPAAADAFVAPFDLSAESIASSLRAAIVRTLRAESARKARAAYEKVMRAQYDLEDDDEAPDERALKAIADAEARILALRAWANHLQKLDDAGGKLADFAEVSKQLGRYEREVVMLLSELSAEIETPPGFALDEKLAKALAGDVGALADDESMWPSLRALARNLGKLGLAGTTLERLLAQLLAIGIRSKDEEAIASVVALAPALPSWDILAFNLACYHAVKGNRDDMLRLVKRSLELGKSPAQFTNDADFAPYLADAELVALFDSVS